MEKKFFNRELSWIEFNARVLNEGTRNELPLLEKIKFLAITESNFDEFFQVRVASIKEQIRNANSNDETAQKLCEENKLILKRISSRCHELILQRATFLKTKIFPELKRNGIRYIKSNEYTKAQKSYLYEYFKSEVFPVLTPLRTDTIILPHIPNLKLTAAFLLEAKSILQKVKNALTAKNSSNLIALVQIPENLERLIWLPSDDNEHTKTFALLEDVISSFASELFPGYKIKENLCFKVNRDADLTVDENNSNFIEAMQEVLEKRQSSFIVRLMYTGNAKKLLEEIKKQLNLDEEDIYNIDSVLNLKVLNNIELSENKENLLYPQWKHFESSSLPKENTCWNSIRQKDILLQTPYESFDSFIKFLKDASVDPYVLAIKMTLYRIGSASPIIQALKEAAQNRKQVTVFVELKARFDEKQNISWVTELEKVGVTVIYGIVNLKVHAKICMIIRKESDGIRRYANLSTGNYNLENSKLYSDLSIFTCRNEITNDATLFFNAISGYSSILAMPNLYMAPISMKEKLLELIDKEIKLSTPERSGHIIAKMNSLCHPQIIEKLYEASKAGVTVELNVRGICTLIPGVKGMSENIKVVSIIDRYLEHSRVFYFENAGDEKLYLSSADWMERNLDRRIELMFPVLDKDIFNYIKEILSGYFMDNTHSYTLQSDGKWQKNSPKAKESEYRAQEVLYKKYKAKEVTKNSLHDSEFSVRRNN